MPLNLFILEFLFFMIGFPLVYWLFVWFFSPHVPNTPSREHRIRAGKRNGYYLTGFIWLTTPIFWCVTGAFPLKMTSAALTYSNPYAIQELLCTLPVFVGIYLLKPIIRKLIQKKLAYLLPVIVLPYGLTVFTVHWMFERDNAMFLWAAVSLVASSIGGTLFLKWQIPRILLENSKIDNENRRDVPPA